MKRALTPEEAYDFYRDVCFDIGREPLSFIDWKAMLEQQRQEQELENGR